MLVGTKENFHTFYAVLFDLVEETHKTKRELILWSATWQNPCYQTGLTHMAKPIAWQNPEGYPWQNPWDYTRLNHMAKPIELQKPLEYPWQKPWNQNCNFRCWVAARSIHFLDSYHDFLGANPY